MPDHTENYKIDLVELSCDLIASYVSNNPVPISELPNLIQSVHRALTQLSGSTAQATSQEDAIEKPTAAQIRKSVSPEGLVSFIDGKSYQTLKRHLTTHGLDPHAYRQRYGLPADYPMVASGYAARRSELAKAIGLGRPAAAPEPVQEEPAQPKARGRTKAA